MDFNNLIKQLVAERDRLNTAISVLQGSNNGSRRSTGRHRLSAKARARIAAAQRARWAKIRAKKS